MALKKLQSLTNLISKLPDLPNGTMSSSQLKAYWDSSPEELRVFVNSLIDSLQSTIDNNSGADNIGATKIDGIEGTTVQVILEGLKSIVDQKTDSSDVLTKTQLQSIEPGNSGASKIKTAPISGLTGDTVQSFLQSLKDGIDQLALNQIPDGSITIDKLNANIRNLFNVINSVYKDVANLNLETEASKRVTNGGTFGSSFDTTFGMTIDAFRAISQTSLEIGATSITLDTVAGLSVGKEVTIFDDVNLERKTITGINGNVITISALTKAFKAQANVARSMVNIDEANKAMKFGGWNNIQSFTQVGKTVVASAYDTAGNGGRKIVRLSNGWIIAFIHKADTGFNILRIKPDEDPILIGTIKYAFPGVVWAVAARGTRIYYIISRSNYADVVFASFDALDGDGGNIGSGIPSYVSSIVDRTQTETGNVSLAIDSTNGHLYAAWASKNASYPNSFNVRYSKSIDDGKTWSTAEQVSKETNSTYRVESPSIVVRDGAPIIIVSRTIGTSGLISSYRFTGSSWAGSNIVNDNLYAQKYPSAAVDKEGVIHVVWQGRDATLTADVPRYSKSPDGGLTWTPMQKLVNINETTNFPSIAVNKSNQVHIMASHHITGNLAHFKLDGDTWVREDITVGGGSRAIHPSTLADNSIDFTIPLTICMGLTSVLFNGVWIELVSTPILENDVRFTIADASQVATWIQRETELTIDAELNGVPFSKSTKDNEDQFISEISPVQPNEVKLKLSRPSTSNELKITRILGGVG